MLSEFIGGLMRQGAAGCGCDNAGLNRLSGRASHPGQPRRDRYRSLLGCLNGDGYALSGFTPNRVLSSGAGTIIGRRTPDPSWQVRRLAKALGQERRHSQRANNANHDQRDARQAILDEQRER